MKSALLTITLCTAAINLTFATDVMVEFKPAIEVRDKGLYKTNKTTPTAYLRSIEDIKRDFLSSSGIFDGTTDFSVPIDFQRKGVVVFRDAQKESAAE